MSRIAEHYLGDTPAKYPERPGFTEPTTSREAALRIAGSGSKKVREDVFGAIAAAGEEGRTADEVALDLGRKPGYVRPRVSELRSQGRIEPTGKTRKNPESTMFAKVWRATK